MYGVAISCDTNCSKAYVCNPIITFLIRQYRRSVFIHLVGIICTTSSNANALLLIITTKAVVKASLKINADQTMLPYLKSKEGFIRISSIRSNTVFSPVRSNAKKIISVFCSWTAIFCKIILIVNQCDNINTFIVSSLYPIGEQLYNNDENINK